VTNQTFREFNSAGVSVGPDGEVAERHCLAVEGVCQLLAAMAELGCEKTGDTVDVPECRR
jgi:hypothetical protein